MSSETEKIQLLDCTFRDGGQGLQASYLYDVPGTSFNKDILSQGINNLRDSACEIIELGYIDDIPEKMSRFASYDGVGAVSKNIPRFRMKNQMYVALFTGPDMPQYSIPDRDDSMVDGLRVILRYSELSKSLDFCEELAQKKYDVFIQPMLTMRYSEEELNLCIKRANKIGAYALYIVDSFGYMEPEDIKRIFDVYNSRLDPNIRIGFHAHNNMNLAYSNTKDFIDIALNTDRKIIVDSTCLGIGQGAGNLQSELIVPYLNRKYGKTYNYNKVLETCEMIEGLTTIPQWGYSVMWALPAVHKAAYKYSLVMRQKLKLSYVIMNQVFDNMTKEQKNRYTSRGLRDLLDEMNINYPNNII